MVDCLNTGEDDSWRDNLARLEAALVDFGID